MVAQLSSLRVTADFDPSGYVRGMGQKISADQAGASSSSQLGAALAKQDMAADLAGGAVSRLSRAYIDGYGTSARFYGAIASLQRQMELGNVAADRAALIYAGLVEKFGMVASAEEIAATGSLHLADVIGKVNTTVDKSVVALTGWGTAFDVARLKAEQAGQAFSTDLNQRLGIGDNSKSARDSAAVFEQAAREADQLEQKVRALRGAIDPLSAAQERLNAELAEYRAYADAGKISTEELTAAQTMATARFNAAQSAIQNGGGSFLGAGNAAKLSAFQIQNLSFQMQDLGQAFLTGQPIFRTVIQQGSQIAQIFGPGVGVAGALRAVGTGILAFVTNPLNLAVLGFAAVGAAAGALFHLIGSGGIGAEATLKQHADTIRDIKAAWEGAATEAEKYGGRVQSAIQFAHNQDLDRLNKQLLDSSSAAIQILARPLSNPGDPYGPYRKSLLEFIKGVDAGKPDVLGFDAAVQAIANKNPGDQRLQEIARHIIDVTTEAAKSATAIKDLVKQFDGMALASARTAEASAQLKYMSDNASALRVLQDRQAAALSAVTAKSPSEKAAAAAAAVSAEPIDFNESPEVRNYRISAASALAYATAVHSLTDAQQERKRALDNTIASAQLDLDLIGKGTAATESARLAFQLTAAVREEAAKNGTAVDQKEIALIQQKAAEYGRLKEQIARASINADISYTRQTMFLSPEDVQIAQTLRSLYGNDVPAALHSTEAAALRVNDAFQQQRDLVREFAGTFAHDLASGKSVLDSLADGLSHLRDKLLDLALDQAVNGIFAKLAGAFSGAATGGFNVHGLYHSGAVLEYGRVAPYAVGGVVDRPTYFPMSGGSRGLMGEAGPEAILPLRRGSDGKLGIASSGGGNRSTVISPVYNITMNGSDDQQLSRLKKTLDGHTKALQAMAVDTDHRNRGYYDS